MRFHHKKSYHPPEVRLLLRWLPLLLLIGAVPLTAQEAGSGLRLEPVPMASALAGGRGELPIAGVAAAALQLSGADGEAGLRGQARIEELAARIRGELGALSDPKERAEAALLWMHRRLLSGYAGEQARLDVLLEQGTYNCVSSAVLYVILARALDLEVWGVQAPDHVFCQVRADGKDYDVETTSPFGLHPGEEEMESRRLTGYASGLPDGYPWRRRVDDRGLLALISYDRLMVLNHRSEFAAAVGPAVDAHALLGDADSRDRLMVSFADLAAWDGMNGRVQAGLDLLEGAIERYGAEERLVGLRSDLAYHGIVELMNAGELARAESDLARLEGRGTLPPERWNRLYSNLVQRQALLASRDSFREASLLIRQAIERLGADPALVRSYEAYTHNQVVALMQAQRREEADRVIGEALQLVPGSEVLQRDRDRIKPQRS